jgi:CubicO group peptidase (beta-lactamase class C family)
MPIRSRRSLTLATGILLSGFLFPGLLSPLSAQDARPGPTDAAEIEAFLDGVMAAHLRGEEVAGATVAVVRDGRILLAKGYGWADVDGRVPVDAERTLFRIGSVTKLFTWTAIMQLVEEGRLGLDDDVNDHLGFRIPDTFGEPITIRDLLQHTPGLEEDSRNLFTDDVSNLRPMSEWLPAHMPARVRPPGTFSAYSNWGTGLAGHIVERVSGMDWDDYLDARILEPLGMTQATGRQPLPEALAPHMSKGYSREGGGYKEEDFELITGAGPAGSMSASATAMARFMIAHLQGGELDGVRILEEETVRAMHDGSFHHDPRINGFGLGFYEKSSHGVRIVGHGGNTRWFHTDLALFPDLGLGIFVSYNTSNGSDLSFGPFLNTVLDQYFPVEYPRYEATERQIEAASALGGTFRFNRSSYTTFQKAFALPSAIKVSPTDDGALMLGLFGPPARFVEEAPLLYREELGETRVAFRVDEEGRATHAFLSPAPMMALERVPWHGLPGLHYSILVGGLLIFVGWLVTGGTRMLRRRFGSLSPQPAPHALRTGRQVMALAAALFVGFAVWLGILVSDFWALLTGDLLGLKLALALPVLGTLAALGAGFFLVRASRSREGSRWARIRLGGAVTIALVFAWSLNYWNLLGWYF